VGAGTIAHRDQERGHVLTVLVGLLECGARAVGGDALAAQANRHFVWLRIGALDPALSVRLVQADVVDDLALLVVQATKERAELPEMVSVGEAPVPAA